MTGVITRIVYQQRNRQRVNVFVDGAFALALPDAEAARLQVGQTLTPADIARLRQIDDAAKAYDKALRLLGSRPRSQQEIAQRLNRAGYPPEIVSAALARLQQQGYLDDAAFIAWWIENRARFSPRGRRALQQELRQKGLDPQMIDQALAMIPDEDQALAAARQRAARWRGLSQEAFDHKLLSFLQRRGFDFETARAAAAQLWQELGAGQE
ncbi:MAG: RecX family transcriptional regulator [Caldilineales bacterium]|nr:RecX family transcriptional regulator [Caldilineales bacterium]